MNIVITGASRGIGYETARILARHPGHKIWLISRNEVRLNALVEEAKAKGGAALIPVVADLQAKDMKSSVENTFAGVKRIDIIIHNAGALVNKPFDQISDEELDYTYNVNVLSVFRLTQVLAPLMGGNSRGHIVNISSMGGFQGSLKFPGLSAYSSSKAALSGLSECLAEEFKERNIAVNCLCLGAVQTEMLQEAFPGYKAPLAAVDMAEWIAYFAQEGHKYFNGKILPVSLSTP